MLVKATPCWGLLLYLWVSYTVLGLVTLGLGQLPLVVVNYSMLE